LFCVTVSAEANAAAETETTEEMINFSSLFLGEFAAEV